MEETNKKIESAVSYTHLDVYKRQVINSLSQVTELLASKQKFNAPYYLNNDK